ncbi:hypothetical protein AWW66_08920 [Micromonospora rosaria]|uniref:Uncharacterized protein n=1 Tax=Micromonospora rosaria TaxID=47874 RepID=A0A136PUZ0_9ACTN|nr:Gfo/Idh/MocA family oxidoreductase [Micromonospora rosaria]KXK62340.1 hypothetical protein AWW66_08920 [Micromonospora rosaria]
MSPPDPTRVALVGALGHGLRHRRAIASLRERGLARLVAVANRRPVTPEADAPLDGVAVFDDHRRLLRESDAEIVVVCTPPHTHLPIARAVVESGRDLLLEKPPVVSPDEYAVLAAALARTGAACQVNFQSLASPALARLGAAATRGALGTPTLVSVAGAWWRPDAYYRRSPWAGRRAVDGVATADGALGNQFAHAVMQCLAVAERVGGPYRIDLVELERYRTRDIEVEDTACLRLTLSTGVRVLVAVSVCAAEFVYGDLAVHGDRGSARLEFPTDRLKLPGDPEFRTVTGRVTMLENLVAHRRDRAVPLLAPLPVTAPVVDLLGVLHAAPEPVPVPRRHLSPHPDGDGQVLTGVVDVIRAAVAAGALFSELGVAWARPAYRATPGPTAGPPAPPHPA